MNYRKLSIILPCYNEEETLQYSTDRLLEMIKVGPWPAELQFEILFVNDGSQDRTAEILNEIQKREMPHKIEVSIYHFSRNFGHSGAVWCGLEKAKGDCLCFIDADLQDPPELIPKMFQEILNGYDVVYGQRVARESENLVKRLTAWFFYRFLNWISAVAIPKDTGDFRLITEEVRQAVMRFAEPDPFMRGLVAWVGFRQKAFPYIRQRRQFGETKYPFSKILKFAYNATLAFSVKPLTLLLTLASCFLVGAIGLGFFAIISDQYPFTWLIILILFCTGVLLLAMALMAAYLARVHIGVQNRPRYLLRN